VLNDLGAPYTVVKYFIVPLSALSQNPQRDFFSARNQRAASEHKSLAARLSRINSHLISVMPGNICAPQRTRRH
jgi:hypothetical protein